MESSRTSGEAATFEVGAGDIVGNNLFQAFDEAVRGLAVGDRVRIKVRGVGRVRLVVVVGGGVRHTTHQMRGLDAWAAGGANVQQACTERTRPHAPLCLLCPTRGCHHSPSHQAEGGEWKQELLFVVPRDHEEVQRLENRYKKWVVPRWGGWQRGRGCGPAWGLPGGSRLQSPPHCPSPALVPYRRPRLLALPRCRSSGGLVPSAVVQLSNGGMAMVVEADEDKVVLDANSALAGKSLVFELELASIERGS